MTIAWPPTSSTEGRIKRHVIAQALRLRREPPRLFTSGEYLPLEVRGEQGQHICAFVRRDGDRVAIVVVPVLIASLLELAESPPISRQVWGKACIVLPDRFANISFQDVLAGVTLSSRGVLPAGDVLESFPVALFVSSSGEAS